jgi:hypothetical protein
MSKLWTKNGRPLSCQGNEVFAPSGALVGRIHGDRVFRAEDGGYVGTLVGDRLIYRTYDIDGPNRAYTRRVTDINADTVPPSHTWGDEPTVPV